jgi:hypothetical protein
MPWGTKTGPHQTRGDGDVFEGRLNSSYEGLKRQCEAQVDVPPERRFLGFDAY